MDPRSFTVKSCPGSYSAKSNADIGASYASRRDFANATNKVGNLSILNSIGASDIGKGLRTLASISNTIRTGCGSIPATLKTIEQGADWALGHMKIIPSTIQAVQSFHPEVANRAWSQAQNLYENVQSGSFKFEDVPFVIQDFQNLSKLASRIFTPGNDRLNGLSSSCEASPYAIDLIARAPKYKFLFIVQFTLAAGYENLDSVLRGMAFVVKKSSRPKITYKTEDVNYYNYRSKLITKVDFEEMNMSFHDDILNNATKFYTAYLRAMSPITNLSPNQSMSHSSYDNLGMNFSSNTLFNNQPSNDSPIVSSSYAASTGLLLDNNKQSIFKEITLYHVFDNGNQVTVYHFINPRITQLIPDDLDMAMGSEGNELTINFCYDNIYVENKTIKELDPTFVAAQSDAFYQLHNNDSASAVRGPNQNARNPYGVSDNFNDCNPLNTVNNGINSVLAVGGGFGGGINQGLNTLANL